MNYVVRNPRTKMFLANREDNPSHRSNASKYRWVRTIGEATAFAGYSDAELPAIFIGLSDPEICPLLSCGIPGDPMQREEAIASGTFHRPRPSNKEQPQ